MRLALRFLLGLLGASAVLITLSILLAGAAPTAWLAEGAFDALTGWSGPDTPAWPATMDSELRFYAALWGAFGLLLLDTARDLNRHGGRTPWLAATFFVGGRRTRALLVSGRRAAPGFPCADGDRTGPTAGPRAPLAERAPR